MRTPLILEAARRYAADATARFHMPGHKAAAEFCEAFPMADIDITELSFSDNLHEPEGVIAEAERNIAEILGAKKSYITTDGSTSAILSMLYAVRGRGKKIVMQRNAHKSIYNALALFSLEPVFLPVEDREGIPLLCSDALGDILDSERDVAGVIVVSPDYYGFVPDLKKIKCETAKRGIPLLIDGAHGGHLRFIDPEKYAGSYADIWVDGVHKTLPCLTQAAVVNINNAALAEGLEEGLSVFRTTSPSYLIMASAEYGVYYAEEHAAPRLKALAGRIGEMAVRLSEKCFSFTRVDDGTKIVLDCERSHADCRCLNSFLEENGIYPELCDGRYIVFMASVMTGEGDLLRLEDALARYRQKYKEVPYIAQKRHFLCETERAMSYLSAVSAAWEYVPLKDAEGRISAGQAGFFPPCYPIITAGEIVGKEAMLLLDKGCTFGIKRGNIKVVR